MQNIKTTCEVKIYDTDELKNIVVKSHILFDDQIILEIDGKKYVVIAQDLKQAISRCSNR